MTTDPGCVVPLPGGTTCGWARDGKHPECAAHRRRLRVHGDYRARIPVLRKPTRRPAEVAQRLAEREASHAEVAALRDLTRRGVVVFL